MAEFRSRHHQETFSYFWRKKLIYNHIDMPLTAIDDMEEKGKNSLNLPNY